MIDNWHHSPPYSFALAPSSPYSSGSSTHSSHLSILTTTSSVSTLSRTSTSSDPADHPPLSPTSSGNKTHAFFASPFSSSASLPLEPPHSAPPAAAAAIGNTTRNSLSDAEATPRLQSAPAPTSKQSLNDSFFSPSWETSSLPPTSPPPRSMLPLPPPPPTAPVTSSRAPLSRVFPSRVRYTSVDELPSREGSPQSYPTILSSPPRLGTGRRQLVELDPLAYQTSHDIEPKHMHIDPTENATAHATHMPRPDDPAYHHLDLRHMAIEEAKLPTPVAIGADVSSRQIVASPVSMSMNGPPLETAALRPGDVIVEPPSDGDRTQDTDREEGARETRLHLVLMKTLGQGAFSSVWLARDETGRVSKLEVSRKNSLKRQKSKRGSLRRSGTTGSLRRRAKRASESSEEGAAEAEEEGKAMEGTVPSIRVVSEESDGLVGSAEGRGVGAREGKAGRLVALKMTDRLLCDKDDRTRVSFVREVEVLKHISHPSIVSYIHAFSTPSHHILVLEHISGGELFDLVSSQETHARLHEPLLRRIFGELARAVAWMHAVGLVHRDIKLENILLTRDVFAQPLTSAPLIKLTDFGLSRFIDPAAPLLTTRCGSESYAAPELVTGRPYDGRETDAWACGVVLYALVTRRLPFDAMNPPAEGGERGEGRKVRGPRRDERSERRALLMRIANGQYAWPDMPESARSSSGSVAEGEGLKGLELARSEGVRRVVGRLLVRDSKKRTKVAQLWEDAWMVGEGAPPAPVLPENVLAPAADAMAWDEDVHEEDAIWDDDGEFGEGWDDDEGVEDEEGVLVDEQDIAGSVACQELVP